MPTLNATPAVPFRTEKWYGNAIRGEIYEDVVMGGATSKQLSSLLPKGGRILGSVFKNATAIVYAGTAVRAALSLGTAAFTVALGGGCSSATLTINATQRNGGSLAGVTGADVTKCIGGTAAEPVAADTSLFLKAVTAVPAADANIVTGTLRVRVFYERFIDQPDS